MADKFYVSCSSLMEIQQALEDGSKWIAIETVNEDAMLYAMLMLLAETADLELERLDVSSLPVDEWLAEEANDQEPVPIAEHIYTKIVAVLRNNSTTLKELRINFYHSADSGPIQNAIQACGVLETLHVSATISSEPFVHLAVDCASLKKFEFNMPSARVFATCEEWTRSLSRNPSYAKLESITIQAVDNIVRWEWEDDENIRILPYYAQTLRSLTVNSHHEIPMCFKRGIETCVGLEYLMFYGTNIPDISEWKSLTNLRSLFLWSITLDDLRPLAFFVQNVAPHLQNLEELDLDDIHVVDFQKELVPDLIFSMMVALSNLEILKISFNTKEWNDQVPAKTIIDEMVGTGEKRKRFENFYMWRFHGVFLIGISGAQVENERWAEVAKNRYKHRFSIVSGTDKPKWSDSGDWTEMMRACISSSHICKRNNHEQSHSFPLRRNYGA